MTSETHLRICHLLAEAQALLDAEAVPVAAIYVTQALEALQCPIGDPSPQDSLTAIQ